MKHKVGDIILNTDDSKQDLEDIYRILSTFEYEGKVYYAIAPVILEGRPEVYEEKILISSFERKEPAIKRLNEEYTVIRQMLEVLSEI